MNTPRVLSACEMTLLEVLIQNLVMVIRGLVLDDKKNFHDKFLFDPFGSCVGREVCEVRPRSHRTPKQICTQICVQTL